MRPSVINVSFTRKSSARRSLKNDRQSISSMAGRRSKEYDPRHRTKSVTSFGNPRQSNHSYMSTDSYFIHDTTSDEKILQVVRCTVIACSLIAAIVAIILDMKDKRWYF